MGPPEGGEVGVAVGIAVHQENGFGSEERQGVSNRPGRAERRRFDGIGQAHSGVVVAERGVHLVRGVARKEDDVADGGADQSVEEMGQKRPAGDGGQHLGAVGDGGAQARSQSPGEYRRRNVVKRRGHEQPPCRVGEGRSLVPAGRAGQALFPRRPSSRRPPRRSP